MVAGHQFLPLRHIGCCVEGHIADGNVDQTTSMDSLGALVGNFFDDCFTITDTKENRQDSMNKSNEVDRLIEQRVGRPVNWIIDYNKLGPPNLSGQYDFYYQGNVLGVDSVGETLDVAEMCGIVEKGGAWYTVNKERFQGRAKAVAYLKENPDVVDNLIEEINAKH